MSETTMRGDWQQYLFVTRELNKFLLQDNWEMVTTLLAERDKLQKLTYEKPPTNIYNEIMQLNQAMTQQLTIRKMQMEKQDKVNRAYEGYSQQFDVGGWMDSRR